MRSEIGKITLDTLLRERDNTNQAIVEAINLVFNSIIRLNHIQ